MTPNEEIERGERAQRLLRDPLLLEAFASVKAAIHERWEQAPVRDKDGAHELKLMLNLLRDVQANLEQAVRNGRFAADSLEKRRFKFF